MALSSVLLAGGMNGALNTVISDYLIPFFAFAIVMGVVTGVVKNWEAINDNTGNGRRKEGFINVAWMVGYVVVAVAVLSAVGGIIRGMTLSI